MARLRAIRWVAHNAAFAWVACRGMFLDDVICARVSLFAAWALFAISLMQAFACRELAKDPSVATRASRRSVPGWVDGTFDVAMTLTFAAGGWTWTAIGHAIGSLCLACVRDAMKRAAAPGAAS